MVIKLSRYGKFIACPGFPECRNTKPMPETRTGVTCPQCHDGEILERRAFVLVIEIVGPGHVVRILVPLVLDGEHVEAARVLHRQRLQQEAIHNRENRGVCANAQPERQHHRDREEGRLEQGPQTQPDVLPERIHI